MNRLEALRALGLDEGATDEDIKTAYRETAQILHPDRFATNKKLQDRATEQFKNLQEAYDFLTSSKGRRKAGGSSASARSTRAAYDDVDARLAGIAAARTQLVRQRDAVYDERRNGLGMAAIGRAGGPVLRPTSFWVVRCGCRHSRHCSHLGHCPGGIIATFHQHAYRAY